MSGHARLGLVLAAVAIAIAAAPGAAAAPALAVIPYPAQVIAGAGSFTVTPATPIRVTDQPQVARIGQYFDGLLRSSGAPGLQLHGGQGAATGAISFRLDARADARPESYEIRVSAQGIQVSARGPAGLLYGAVTLWQLCTAEASGEMRIPAVRIADAPRLRWRGLMLDSARHFQSPEFIIDYIDWMALHKLNVLSWHLTDDQGWRLQIRKYPRLTEVGAWRVPAGAAAQHDLDPATGKPRLYGGFYTQEDVRRIVAHAAARNVMVVPEIDLPGHTTAAIVAYPQLAVTADPPTVVPADWGVYPNLVNVEESTFGFFEDVLAEVMALFPAPYIHAGGDEAVKEQWHASARVQARMRELKIPDEVALQGYFTQRIANYLKARGRTLVGWDEILAGGLPADAVVMSWRGVHGAIAAAAAGHDTVLSPDPELYLDHRQGSGPSEPPGRGPLLSLEDVYRFDPLPGALAHDTGHVLGVQANLWTEHVRTEQRAAYMTYPRAAALAELAWSAPAQLDYADFVQRLGPQLARYRGLGIGYSEAAFAPVRSPGPAELHMSQDLKSCSNRLVLNLEDDAPLHGPRAVFLIDVMDPCWVLPGTELPPRATLTAAVGQVPFNFLLGKDVAAIHLNPPATASGELQVRIDGCEGAPVAVLSLAPALASDGVTVLPAVALPARPGRHELCFRFTQAQLDPLWAIDSVQVRP